MENTASNIREQPNSKYVPQQIGVITGNNY